MLILFVAFKDTVNNLMAVGLKLLDKLNVQFKILNISAWKLSEFD